MTGSPLDERTRARLATARLAAITAQPFLASVLFTVTPVAVPGLGTFAVDRHWRLYVDPARFDDWGPRQAGAVLLHEAAHLVRGHADRAAHAGVCTTTDAAVWNLATDAAINDDLDRDGLELPFPVLPATLGLPPHGTEEAYYRQLRAELAAHPSALPDTLDCGSGSHHRPRPWETDSDLPPPPTPAATRRARSEVIDTIRHDPSTVPPRWRQWASTERPARHLPWQQLLAQRLATHLGARTGTTYPTWRRPNRRHDHPVVLRPGRRHRSRHVAVIIDTSASIAPDELHAALVELGALLDVSDTTATVIVCDRDVHGIHTVEHRHDLSSIELAGGGGTDLRAAFDQLDGLDDLALIVVFTDGWTPWPDLAPGPPVLVVTTDEPGPCWADTLTLTPGGPG